MWSACVQGVVGRSDTAWAPWCQADLACLYPLEEEVTSHGQPWQAVVPALGQSTTAELLSRATYILSVCGVRPTDGPQCGRVEPIDTEVRPAGCMIQSWVVHLGQMSVT